MRPVSSQFLSALRQSHKVIQRVDVYRGTALILTLPVIAGKVDVDTSNSVQRRCTITAVDTTGLLTPADAAATLAPFGNEIRLFRGIEYPDGTQEMVPVGVFGISDVEVKDEGAGIEIEVSGFDRARKVARNRFTDIYTVTAGTNYATAIRDLVNSRVPGLTFNFMVTTRTAPALTFQVGDDPWEKAQDMADSLGAELFFDGEGVCVLRPVIDPETAPVVYDYTEGQVSNLISLSRSLTDEQTYNLVVAAGEPADPADGSEPPAPARGVAQDDDPASPTWVGGPYGVVPKFFVSPFIATDAQAVDAAKASLLRSLGGTEVVAFDALVNPAHEVGDVVQVTRGASRANARYVIDSFTIPLDANSTMSVTTRKRRT